MNNDKVIQWYPGHMKKADREIRDKLKLIDVVIEVLDARVNYASRNPDIKKYTRNKDHIIILNKADLADPDETNKWINKLKQEDGVTAVLTYNATDQTQRNKLVNSIKNSTTKDRNELRCLVVGIPNVGKSTVINSILKKRKTQIGNKPGVTKGQQWLTTDDGLILLDTPGILWPKFEDQEAANHLAWIGSINDKIYDKENIAGDLVKFLLENYPQNLEETYGIEVDPDQPAWVAFDQIAEARHLLRKGGEYDYLRTSEMILNDFRNGKLGRITINQL